VFSCAGKGSCTEPIPHPRNLDSETPKNGRFCEVMTGMAIKIYIHRSYIQEYPKLKYFVIKKKL